MLADLRKFKLAKIVKKDFACALPALDTAVTLLEPFAKYRSVANCLKTLKTEREAMKAHLKEYESIEKNRGR